MNKVVSIETGREIESSHRANAGTEMLIQEMAYQLFAGILGGLNTASDQQVIEYLFNAPQRYHQRLILNNYREALYEAKQMMIASEKPGEV